MVKELGLDEGGEEENSQIAGIKGWLDNRLKLNWGSRWDLGEGDGWDSAAQMGCVSPEGGVLGCVFSLIARPNTPVPPPGTACPV